MLIALAVTLPFLIGFTAEVVFPIFLKLDAIPIAPSAIGIFSILMFIAIVKYKALTFSPKHQWGGILESMNEGLVIINNEARIMYANAVFCNQTGYTSNELKGQIAHTFLFKETEECEKSIKGLKERLENKPGQFEILLTTKIGEKKWMILNATPYLDAKGKVIGSIGLFTNINELKLANKELELFTYKASHDLRGPLASILGLSALVKKEKDSREVANYLNMIEAAAKKLDTIIITLIKGLQIKDTKYFEDKVNLNELLDEIIKRFVGYEGFSAMEITKTDSLNESIYSSKLILDSIFQNIVENVIKYRNVEVLKSYLKIDITKKENNIQITFEDNGIGINAEVVDKIFDMYYRASTKAKGTGLGLYLVKNGINKLDGTIVVESEFGRGTRFIITLPVRVSVN